MRTTSDAIGGTGPAQFDEQNSGIDRRFEGSLRVAVRAMDRQVSLLATHTTSENAAAVGGLVASWAELVDQLALGPAPDVRGCPVCGRVGMSAATLCGYCWARLTPSPPRGGGE